MNIATNTSASVRCAPAPIGLACAGLATLALGGHFKNAVCVTRGDQAFLAQHVGDLDSPASRRALDGMVEYLLRTLGVEPAVVAHDLHPDFYSTSYAAAFARDHNVPLLAVQHHHAHIAAVAAEHRLRVPLLGLALDGTGLGSDGGIWGGELLRVEGATAQRIGHLRELRLPGGDRAAREPWRMAVSALFAMGRLGDIERRFARRDALTLTQMLRQSLNSPASSSMGRWFDAAAGLLGVIEVCSYEGEAAMRLEELATCHGPVAALAGGVRIGPDHQLDLLPLLEYLADIEDAGLGAALFHSTLAAALASWVCQASERSGVRSVAFGGGCFMNRTLAANLRRQLQAAGLTVFEARQAPPGDGGLALGQAAVAMARAEG